MTPNDPNPRTVVRQPLFTEQLDKIEPYAPRADDFMKGVEWVLARSPEIGQQLNLDSRVWVVTFEETHGFPGVVIYYAFSSTHVLLLSIRTVLPNNGES